MTQADQKNVFSDYKVLSAGAFKRYRSPKVAISEIGLILMGKTVCRGGRGEHGAGSTAEGLVCCTENSKALTKQQQQQEQQIKDCQLLCCKFILL